MLAYGEVGHQRLDTQEHCFCSGRNSSSGDAMRVRVTIICSGGSLSRVGEAEVFERVGVVLGQDPRERERVVGADEFGAVRTFELQRARIQLAPRRVEVGPAPRAAGTLSLSPDRAGEQTAPDLLDPAFVVSLSILGYGR